MRYIQYRRVSTKEQGASGLGLSAQQSAIDRFIKEDDEIIGDFCEVESGRNNKRPELLKAIGMVKANEGSKLLIAKIDRLARNLSFITNLMDSGVDFVAIDFPQANRLTIQIISSIAEHEALLIKERTKAALAQLKKQGVKLGSPKNLDDSARAKGLAKMRENAFEENKQAGQLIILLRNQGLSYQKIADHLNENGYRTRRDKAFQSSTIQNLYKRFKDHFNYGS